MHLQDFHVMVNELWTDPRPYNSPRCPIDSEFIKGELWLFNLKNEMYIHRGMSGREARYALMIDLILIPEN